MGCTVFPTSYTDIVETIRDDGSPSLYAAHATFAFQTSEGWLKPGRKMGAHQDADAARGPKV
jgi:hypothetical protein